MEDIALSQMLTEVIELYGKNEGYAIPTISWSEENMTSRYGEYQFWHNHIIISNLLNTDKVSKKAVMSVVFHEYTHQLYKEHNKKFDARMRLFKGYRECQKELESYFDSITALPEARRTELLLNAEDEIFICKFPYDPADMDSYWRHLLYYNHYVTGNLSGDIPKDYCGKLIKQVIWVVESLKNMFVVGWCRDVQMYPTIQKADLKGCGMDIIEYQFKYRQKDGKFLLPCNVFEGLYDGESPESLVKKGICNAEEIEKSLVKEIVNLVNSYDVDYMDYGMVDAAMNAIPGIETGDVTKLIQMSKEADGRDRAFLIMNKAVDIEKSYRTYLHRGLAFQDAWIFDKALSDFEKALLCDEDADEQIGKAEIKELIIQTKKAMAAI